MLITASSDGRFDHSSLLETFRVIEVVVQQDIQLLIPFARTGIHPNSEITDSRTMADLNAALNKPDKILSEGVQKRTTRPYKIFFNNKSVCSSSPSLKI